MGRIRCPRRPDSVDTNDGLAQRRVATVVSPEQFGQIADPDDRKFAALAYRAEAVLITQDDDLLSARSNMAVAVETASEFVGHWLRTDAP